LHAKRGFDDLQSHYTVNGAEPTAHSPSFDTQVSITKAGTVQVTPFRKGLRYDNAMRFTLVDNLASGHTISFVNPPSKDYAPGDVLIDGVMGSSDFHDGRWAAWHDDDLDTTIDLHKETAIHSVDVAFLLEPASRILLPEQVTYAVSSDGQHWATLYSDNVDADFASAGRNHVFRFHSDKPVTARYVRIQATQRKTVPTDFSNGAKDTWLFADELLIQ
jgi:hexosaminidase